MLQIAVVFFAAILAFLPGCRNGSSETPDGGGDDVTSEQLDVSRDVATCDPGQSICEGACVDVRSDRLNCGACGTVCGAEQTCQNRNCIRPCDSRAVTNVDLLFVIDDSGSMENEQRKLEAQLPILVQSLTTGDLDPEDGLSANDFPPVTSLNVGFVSTDMGIGRTLAGCRNHDGRLFGQAGAPAPILAGCAGSERILSFDNGDSLPEFSEQLSCILDNIGTSGCGVERPLDAMLRAVSPSAPGQNGSAPELVLPIIGGQSGGNAGPGGLNEGFVRADSVLAIVIVTDEADASPSESITLEAAFQDGTEPHFARRVALDTALQRSSATIAQVIANLRVAPNRVVVGAIVGLPVNAPSLPIPELLGRVEMRPAPYDSPDDCPSWVFPSTCAGLSDRETELVPVCADAELPTNQQSVAQPGGQFLMVIQDLNRRGVAHTTYASICAANYRPAIRNIAVEISEAMAGQCE